MVADNEGVWRCGEEEEGRRRSALRLGLDKQSLSTVFRTRETARGERKKEKKKKVYEVEGRKEE